MSFMRGAATAAVLNGLTFKALTGTTPAAEGGQENIPHGLNFDDIVAWQSWVELANGEKVTQSHQTDAGKEYQVFLAPTDMIIQLDGFAAEQILSRPLAIIIWYKA